MAEFKSITTQEEFDERIKERLERAEKKVREEYKGWTSPDDLKALNEKHGAEILGLKKTHADELKKYEGYDKTFEEQKSKIHSLEVSALKTRIANAKQLPYDAIEFLQGDDEQSINESADRLSKLSGGYSHGFTRNLEAPQESAIEQAYRGLAKSFEK